MVLRSRRASVEQKIGKPPGALEFIGTQKVVHPFAEVYRYQEHSIDQARACHPVDCADCFDVKFSSWMNVIGIHDVDFVHQVAEQCGMHVLQQEVLLKADRQSK